MGQAAPGASSSRPRPSWALSPRRCLVWEDAPAGVLAAKAASMACIAVPEQGEEHQPAFALADVVLGSLLEMDAPRFDAFCATPARSA